MTLNGPWVQHRRARRYANEFQVRCGDAGMSASVGNSHRHHLGASEPEGLGTETIFFLRTQGVPAGSALRYSLQSWPTACSSAIPRGNGSWEPSVKPKARRLGFRWQTL